MMPKKLVEYPNLKGWVTPLARYKDNCAGLMTTSQLAEEVHGDPVGIC